jgi:prolyl 3-hydroxylase /prolyl 3,4-dihydroxylase
MLPYPHCTLTSIMDPSFCKGVIRELKDNLTATYKESDLFKFYQTLDLGNLQEGTDLAKSIPKVMELRKALFGKQWR